MHWLISSVISPTWNPRLAAFLRIIPRQAWFRFCYGPNSCSNRLNNLFQSRSKPQSMYIHMTYRESWLRKKWFWKKTKNGSSCSISKIKLFGILLRKRKASRKKCGSSLIVKSRPKFLNGPKSRKGLKLNSKIMIWPAKNAEPSSTRKSSTINVLQEGFMSFVDSGSYFHFLYFWKIF